MNKVIIKTEVGALPMGEEKRNQLVIYSLEKSRNFTTQDEVEQARSIEVWLSRFVPHTLYSLIKNALNKG